MSELEDVRADAAKQMNELRVERDRWKQAHVIACQGITQLNDQKRDLTQALEISCVLIDSMLTEMRMKDLTPSAALMISHGEWARAMRKVLGSGEEKVDPDEVLRP